MAPTLDDEVRAADGHELLRWLASLPPSRRDGAVEEHLGIASSASSTPPGADLVGYHASGVASVVRMLREVPVGGDDTLIDLGSGLGKVVLLARLLTGATARGIELQPELVAGARAAARSCGAADASFVEGDVRRAVLEDGTVFYLYVPFTGAVMHEMLGRLRSVAARRAIVVCSLGVDLDRDAPWLARRTLDSFWLSVYDSIIPGVPPRPLRARSLSGPEVDVVAFERPALAGRGTRNAAALTMIRKLTSGQFRLYSQKKDPKTGHRRNLGTFATREAAEKHERDVQYFKRH